MGCLEGNFEISLQILSPRINVGALPLLLAVPISVKDNAFSISTSIFTS